MALRWDWFLPYILSFSTLPILITHLVGLRFVGLTGGISTGKSSTSRILKLWGVPVIDFDQIARKVVEPGSSLLPKIEKEFGKDVISADGTLDREKLGQIIFKDASKRRKLNAMMQLPIFMEFIRQAVSLTFHRDPEIAANIERSGINMGVDNAFGGHKIIVLDIPLLFEAGFDMICWKTVFVGCSEETQIKRLMARDRITHEQAEAKISAQMSNAIKSKRATKIINNDEDQVALAEATKFWWAHIIDDLGIDGGFSSFIIPTAGATVFSGLSFVVVSLLIWLCSKLY